MSQRAGNVLFVAALLARLLLVATSTGTSDVVYKSVWAKLAVEHGTAGAYARSPFLNEPPLIISLSASLYRYAESSGASFADLYRLVQILADVITTLLLLRLGGRGIALLYFASPAAIFISGFHCNADPLLVCLIVAAIAAAAPVSPRPFALVLSGVLLGAATGVKVVALLLVPLFVVWMGRRVVTFVAGYAVAVAVIFGIPAMTAGPAVLTNTFGYQGVGNWWGVVSMMRVAATQGLVPAAAAQQLISAYSAVLRPAVVIAVAVVALTLWRRRSPAIDPRAVRSLLIACAALLSIIIVLGSGFGVQYLLWPLPFVAFALRGRVAMIVHAIISAFLFVVYTDWSGGFPWDFANSDASGATTTTHVILGWMVWATLLMVTVAAMRALRAESAFSTASHGEADRSD